MQQDDVYAWVERARRGEPTALGWLYDRYYDRIFRYVLFKVGSTEEAEDLTAQVFLRMIESISTFHWHGSSFVSWLYRIAHNQVIDLLRRRTRRPQVALDPLASVLIAETGDPHEWAEAALLRGQLRAALSRLTDLQAQVIALKFGGGLSNAEIGQVLSRSEGAIKAAQHSALENLYKWLRKQGALHDAADKRT